MVFVPELGGEGFNITVFEPGTRNTSIQEKRSHCCHCADYSPPPRGRWQDRSSQKVRGQRVRVQELRTHTYTPKQFISITNHSAQSKVEKHFFFFKYSVFVFFKENIPTWIICTLEMCSNWFPWTAAHVSLQHPGVPTHIYCLLLYSLLSHPLLLCANVCVNGWMTVYSVK